ncbi:hypothetical protein [Pseudoalteromonas sp. S2755]|uniref:hypothetical protein n=1 Tax=Pseudoalteromonas sp. S2755 TaxID=2066523 RepID=UPI00110BEF8A|nr:hypothetical protein [Pseudoalteromonas sp. S2755]TMN40513.1 hypothetical protein CWC03_08655 [Pseudoalteromonas sp. S2755]
MSNSDVFGRVEWTIRDLEGKMSPEEIIQANELIRDFVVQHRRYRPEGKIKLKRGAELSYSSRFLDQNFTNQ